MHSTASTATTIADLAPLGALPLCTQSPTPRPALLGHLATQACRCDAQMLQAANVHARNGGFSLGLSCRSSVRSLRGSQVFCLLALRYSGCNASCLPGRRPLGSPSLESCDSLRGGWLLRAVGAVVCCRVQDRGCRPVPSMRCDAGCPT